MTLKTNKEQLDLLLSAPFALGLLSHTILMDLCYDADRARELEEENTELRNIAGNRGAIVGMLENEVSDLRAKLDEALIVLIPFSQPQFSEELGGNVEGAASIVYARNGAVLRIGDFRRAAAFRAPKEQEKV